MSLNAVILLILIGGYAAGKLFFALRLPGVFGMTLWGIGLSVLFQDTFPPVLDELSGFLRSTALIIILLIGMGLFTRSAGVWLATSFSTRTWRERLFCMIAYTPKATVQAARGAVALSFGLPYGKQVLAYAVLAFLITAPLGLLGIRLSGRYLLDEQF